MMEYQFDYATFCKTFNVKDDKAIAIYKTQ